MLRLCIINVQGFHDWELYIIMEYCDQGSLSAQIRAQRFWNAERNEPDLKAIVTVAHQIASGMAYLHGKHILHGGASGCEPGLTVMCGSWP